MFKRILFLFFLVVWGNVLLLHAEYFSHIGLSEGLSSPSVMAIYQDCLGRMWFGTREGINVYDGNRIAVYKGWVQTEGDTIPSIWLGNEVSAIEGFRNGNVYILVDGRLIEYDIRGERFRYMPEGDRVSALAAFDGNVWYTRQDSLFRLKDGNDKPDYVLKIPVKSGVGHLCVEKEHVYISTINGLYIINRQTDEYEHLLKGMSIYNVFESSKKELWIGTRMNGLYKMDVAGQMQQIPYRPGNPEGIGSQQIRNFVEDDEGNVWFGTFDGLYKYSLMNQKFQLISIPKYMGGLTHPSIFSLYKDMQGTIWIGSYFGGVNYFTPQRTDFVHYNYKENVLANLNYSYIGDLLTDKNGHLWFGTDGGGICCVDGEWNILKQYTAGRGNALPHNNIKGICYDRQNDCLYIATYLGGLSRYDLPTGRFHNYLHANAHVANVPTDVVFHVKMYRDQLCLSARDGVFRLDTRTQQFHKFPVPSIYYEHFDVDEDGNMYLIGGNALVVTSMDRPDSVTRISLNVEGCHVTTNKVLATSQGAYITTLGNGLFFYDRKNRKIARYTVQDSQLANDFCYNLCQTPEGRILITHPKGISCLMPDTQTFITLDFMRKFPSAHIINGCGIYASADGKIYMGDTEGITSFYENELFKSFDADTLDTHFYFSELRINSRLILPNDGTKILREALPYTRQLKLNHLQNNLTIRFACSNYKELLSERWFMYKLEGYDRQWVKSKQTELYYTNLNPGEYMLRVVAVDEYSGKRLSDELLMRITISAPWYDTWWAWVVYIGTFVICVCYFISNRIARNTLALSLEKERFEKQQVEQLNQEKLVFFTNVSHEFRTPLTLIISHVDLLLRNSLNPAIYNAILKIRKNAQYMNNLISELLEFRKLEQNRETFCLKHLDIVTFLKEICLSFADYADRRRMSYRFSLPDVSVMCWFDPRLMEKVFFNLFSNAFKYTADEGEITLSGKVVGDDIFIRISDTGVGISEQDAEKIFDRFYQAAGKKDIFKGTGIGLALTKRIVEKHHGEISVDSVVGKGSTFTVRLPLLKEVFMQDANVQFSSERDEPVIISDPIPVAGDEEDAASPNFVSEDVGNYTYTILLVEDNEELLQVLKELFSPSYNVICAHNGKEGLERIYEEKPDLVVSDIMMPEMTGTEMCLQIKNNIDFCHIPVILLTALNSPEQNLMGLNRGADDYITKPFHAQLLLARVNNLIRNRLLIQRQFNRKPIAELDLTSINPLDKDLLKRTVQIIEKHIDDVDFDIPELCREVGIGRSLLYTKFKALTGMTPNNFILDYRLQHAAVLLQKHPELSIAEISDRCGFNTTVYFSRCFKNQYECTPREYQKRKRHEEKKTAGQTDTVHNVV